MDWRVPRRIPRHQARAVRHQPLRRLQLTVRACKVNGGVAVLVWIGERSAMGMQVLEDLHFALDRGRVHGSLAVLVLEREIETSLLHALSGNQWQSVAISGTQWQSVVLEREIETSLLHAISDNQWQSVAISRP